MTRARSRAHTSISRMQKEASLSLSECRKQAPALHSRPICAMAHLRRPLASHHSVPGVRRAALPPARPLPRPKAASLARVPLSRASLGADPLPPCVKGHVPTPPPHAWRGSRWGAALQRPAAGRGTGPRQPAWTTDGASGRLSLAGHGPLQRRRGRGPDGGREGQAR